MSCHVMMWEERREEKEEEEGEEGGGEAKKPSAVKYIQIDDKENLKLCKMYGTANVFCSQNPVVVYLANGHEKNWFDIGMEATAVQKCAYKNCCAVLLA